MAYTQPKITAVQKQKAQEIQARASEINNMTSEQRLKLWADVSESLINPDKTSQLSQAELIAFATSGNKQEQLERRTILAETATQVGRKQYKYNVNQDGANELLYDIRNFHNFRGTREEFIANPTFNSPIRPGTSPSKSYYMSTKDFLFSNEFDLNVKDDFISKPEVQSIVLNEFQPQNIAYMTKYAGTLLRILEGEKGPISNFISGVFNFMGNVSAPLSAQSINALIERYSANPSLLYGNSSPAPDSIGNPIEMIRKMFNGGKWLNTYELPFFKNTYLEAKMYEQWTVGGIDQQMGDNLSKIAKDGLSIDFPTTPTFKIGDMGKAGYSSDSLHFSFYLINKSVEWLERNFRFLHAFYAGTQWLSLTGGFVKSPNVYHVLCPGRFQIFWAAVGSNITFEGKLRKNDYMNKIYGKTIKSINSDTLWPDAWKIDIQIKDLTPNNFNTYAEYFVHGYGSEDQLKILQNLTNTSSGIAGAYTGETLNNKFTQELKEEAQKLRNEQDAQYAALMNINAPSLTTANNATTSKVLFNSEAEIQKQNQLEDDKNSRIIREYNRTQRLKLNEMTQQLSQEEQAGLRDSVNKANANLQKVTNITYNRDTINRRQ